MEKRLVQKKQWKIIIMFIILALIFVLSNTVQASSPDDAFTIENGIITQYKGSDSNITIPSLIKGQVVYGIGDSVFANNKKIVSVTMPDTITSIGGRAFENCSNMIKIKLSDNLEDFGEYAFSECSSLEEIDIPGTVNSIGAYESSEEGYIFNACSSLKQITFHSETQIIGDYAFLNCENIESVILPETIRIIGTWSFGNCYGLKDITLNDELQQIGPAAFYQCSSLNNIIMPNSVTKIGTHCFRGCTALSDIDLSDNISVIPYRAFSDCKALRNVDLPDALSGIDAEAFYQSGLESINISHRTQTIGDRAFYKCTQLNSVEMSDSVLRIGEGSFAECTNLAEVDFSNSVEIISNKAFYNCALIKAMDLPRKLHTIGDDAFYNCRLIKTVVLPEYLESIGIRAFQNCTSLVEVINKSKINIEKGSEDNGYVGYYCIAVSNGSEHGKFMTYNKFDFYIYENTNYLLGQTEPSSYIRLPKDYNSQNYEVDPFAFVGSTIDLIEIPITVLKIGDYAFVDCNRLLKVTYEGTKNDWAKIDFGIGNELLTDNKYIYFVGEVPTESQEKVSIIEEIKNWISDLLRGHIFFLNFILTLWWGLLLLYSKHADQSDKAYNRRKKWFVIIVCLQWILISGLRADTVGADTANYMRLFDNHASWSWEQVISGLKNNYLASVAANSDEYEPGYILLEKIIGSFTHNHVIYKLIIASIFMSAFGYYIYDNSQDPCLSFVLYEGFFYNMFSLTGYRQTVSVAIGILWAYKFIKERKPIPFFITVFIAAMFHKSTLIIIPFYFIANKKITGRYIAGMASIIFGLIVLRTRLFNVVKVLVGYEQYSGTYGFAQQTFLFLLLVITIAVICFKKQIIEYDEKTVIYYNGLILAWMMMPFAMVSPTAMRLVYDFAFVLTLLVPSFVYSLYMRSNRRIIYWGIILVFGYFILTRTPEYLFFWQVKL